MVSLDADVTRAGVRRVLWATLGLNLAVSAGKVLVGLASGSLAMVADGYHSLVDGSNNVLGLVVAAFAFAPPDRGHPYGHRKFETAATAVIGTALLGLAYHVAHRSLPAGLRFVVLRITQVVRDGCERDLRRLEQFHAVCDDPLR